VEDERTGSSRHPGERLLREERCELPRSPAADSIYCSRIILCLNTGFDFYVPKALYIDNERIVYWQRSMAFFSFLHQKTFASLLIIPIFSRARSLARDLGHLLCQEFTENGESLGRIAYPEQMPRTIDLSMAGIGDLFCYYAAVLRGNEHISAAR
jgi:hypothetical protein